MSCECYKIGGPWISYDPDCYEHGDAARAREAAQAVQEDELARLKEVNELLARAVEDLLNGWKYIRSTHGDLYGVGWDRAQDKADAALTAYRNK